MPSLDLTPTSKASSISSSLSTSYLLIPSNHTTSFRIRIVKSPEPDPDPDPPSSDSMDLREPIRVNPLPLPQPQPQRTASAPNMPIPINPLPLSHPRSSSASASAAIPQSQSSPMPTTAFSSPSPLRASPSFNLDTIPLVQLSKINTSMSIIPTLPQIKPSAPIQTSPQQSQSQQQPQQTPKSQSQSQQLQQPLQQPQQQATSPPQSPYSSPRIGHRHITPISPILHSNWIDSWDLQPHMMNITPTDVTRHLILIRHGHYHDTDAGGWNEGLDENMVLTETGIRQAELTGARLASMNIPFHALHHSTMTRAQQTAQIISRYIPQTPVYATQMLCEGVPVQPNPEHPTWKPQPEVIATDHTRLEHAFHHYFHRDRSHDSPTISSHTLDKTILPESAEYSHISTSTSTSSTISDMISSESHNLDLIDDGISDDTSDEELHDTIATIHEDALLSTSSISSTSSKHTNMISSHPPSQHHQMVNVPSTGEMWWNHGNDRYEILVCHGNVIRFFLLRALQLPTNAWLRMCVNHCSISIVTIPPCGRVSVSSIGDCGHIDFMMQTA